MASGRSLGSVILSGDVAAGILAVQDESPERSQVKPTLIRRGQPTAEPHDEGPTQPLRRREQLGEAKLGHSSIVQRCTHRYPRIVPPDPSERCF